MKSINDRVSKFSQYQGNSISNRVNRFTQYKDEDEEKRKAMEQLDESVGTKRSMLDRGLDLISAGQYVSAGIAKGIVDEDSTVIGNVLSGLSAANPFGKGNEAGEHSYSDVLEESGWKPESLSGKVLKGTVGFLGDVFLDPTTYLTLGMGAAIKGGKGALQGAKVADKLIDIEKATDVVRKFVVNSGEEISEEQIAKQAEKLLSKHNKLMGVNTTPRGIELSLANAPFGDKIFGSLSQAKKTLKTGERVAEFGDKTLAPTYQKLRSDLMKTKFADLFSKNSRLYKMALDEPDELYKYMRSEIMQKKQAGDVIKEKLKIAQNVKKMRDNGFTPDEIQQVNKLMEDPSTFNVIYADDIKIQKEAIQTFKDKINMIETDLTKYVDANKGEIDELNELLNISDDKIGGILAKIADNDLDIKNFKEESKAYKEQLNELMNMRKNEIVEDLATIPTPVLSKSGKLSEVNDILAKSLDELTSKPIVEIDKTDEARKAFEATYKGMKQVEADKFADVKKSFADASNNPPIKIADYESITNDNVQSFIGNLNSTYGLNISPFANSSVIKEMHKAIIDGMPRERILSIYTNKHNALSGYDTKINKRLAAEFGYGNYEKEIRQPLETLRKKIESGSKLTQQEASNYNILLNKARAKNAMYFDLTSKYKSVDELDKFITDEANLRAMSTMDEYKKASTGDEKFMDALENRRQGFADDVRKINRNGETIKDIEYSVGGGRTRTPRYKPELDADELALIDVDVADLLNANTKDPKTIAMINKIKDEVPNVIKSRHAYALEQSGYNKIKIPYLDELDVAKRTSIYKQALRNVNYNAKTGSNTGEMLSKEVKASIKNDILKADVDDVVELTTKIDSAVPEAAEYSKSFAEQLGAWDEVGEKIAAKMSDMNILDNEIKELRKSKYAFNKQLKRLDADKKKMLDLHTEKSNLVLNKTEEFNAEIMNYTQRIKDSEYVINRESNKLISLGQNPNNYEIIGKLYKLDSLKLDARIVKTTKMLRENFMKIGQSEVNIGKFEQEAFDAWSWHYLPHILSEEGSDFIKQNAEQVNKALPGFDAKKIGYGRTFNPFSKERGMKNIILNGEKITNPNIGQLNEYFQNTFPELKDSKVFIDDFTDLYIQRAVKNVDVMYDHKYMNEMLGMLGSKNGGVIPKGKKAVMNYGVLRDRVLAVTRKEFGQTWDDYDLANKVTEELGSKFGQGTQEFTKAYNARKMEYIEELTDRVLEVDYKLPKGALQDLSMPMIELNDEQVKFMFEKYGQNSDVFDVNDLIVDKANQSRKYQILKDNNQLLDMFDKFTHFIKLNQTTVMPGFHVRNKIGNMFNNYLSIGSDAVNPNFQATAHRALKANGNIDDMLIVNKKDGSVFEMAWRDIYEKAQQYGILDEGFFEKDLGTTSAMASSIPGLPQHLNPLNTRKFKPYEIGAKVGTHVEGMDKLIHFASQLSRGLDAQEAYESVNKYLFNYGDLTAFEQNVMKRIFPYYTWIRKNAPLQLETMLENPEKFRNVSKVTRGISKMNNQEDRMEDKYTAGFAQDWIQMPFKSKEGNPVVMNPSLPMGDINRIPDLTDLGGSIGDLLSQMNPILKVPTEFATNKNFFLDKEIFREDENKVKTAIDYILSQGSYYNTGKNIINDKGTDKALRVLNALAGIKFSEYEYEKYKGIMQGGNWNE